MTSEVEHPVGPIRQAGRMARYHWQLFRWRNPSKVAIQHRWFGPQGKKPCTASFHPRLAGGTCAGLRASLQAPGRPCYRPLMCHVAR